MPNDDEGIRWSGLVVRTGVPLPPAAGPNRTAMLRRDGTSTLRNARREFGSALRSLQGLSPDILPRAPYNAPHRWPTSELTLEGYTRVGTEWLLLRRRLAELPAAEAATLAGIRARLEEALKAAVAAYNFLEDEPEEDCVHTLAHAIGELRSGLFGCPVTVKDRRLINDCPLSLLHFRMGMSMGFTAARLCSICRKPLDVCEHLLGRVYATKVGRVGDTCTACGLSDCDHQVGETVLMWPSVMIADIDLREVSLVYRPRDPLARISEFSFPIPKGKEPSYPPACLCWRPCSGFWDLSGGTRERTLA